MQHVYGWQEPEPDWGGRSAEQVIEDFVDRFVRILPIGGDIIIEISNLPDASDNDRYLWRALDDYGYMPVERLMVTLGYIDRSDLYYKPVTAKGIAAKKAGGHYKYEEVLERQKNSSWAASGATINHLHLNDNHGNLVVSGSSSSSSQTHAVAPSETPSPNKRTSFISTMNIWWKELVDKSDGLGKVVAAALIISGGAVGLKLCKPFKTGNDPVMDRVHADSSAMGREVAPERISVRSSGNGTLTVIGDDNRINTAATATSASRSETLRKRNDHISMAGENTKLETQSIGSIATNSSGSVHVVNGDLNGGINGDVHTERIRQRHIKSTDLSHFTVTFSSVLPVEPHCMGSDLETRRYFDEWVAKLKEIGYIIGSPNFYLTSDFSKPGETEMVSVPGKTLLKIYPQDNTIDP